MRFCFGNCPLLNAAVENCKARFARNYDANLLAEPLGDQRKSGLLVGASLFGLGKKGQVSAFVIIALVIVVGLVLFFVFSGQLGGEDNFSAELAPVFEFYQLCIESEAQTAVRLAGIQGGRVAAGEYVPGSEYAPFSSHLNFFGSPVAYWYYVSGNGLIEEQVPSRSEMEVEIADYVSSALGECNFEIFYQQGFEIDVSEPVVNVDVFDEEVFVKVDSEMVVSKDSDTGRKTVHEVEISSKLGKFYDIAREIYSLEKESSFLEEYAVDVLYNYAPVDGVELQCVPEIWLTSDVFDSLKGGLETNFQTIKFSGDYYELENDERNYFVQELGRNVDESVQIIYSGDWPTKIEVYGDQVDEDVMIAEAVGTQEGLGILGFCYVPYHFVYDLSFPALIQVYDTEEVFQFPVVVVIDNNVPRLADFSADLTFEEERFDLCEFKTEDVSVSLYDVNLNPVDGAVSYECFSQRCRIGETQNGEIRAPFPACLNGFVSVRAEGFADGEHLFSSSEEGFAEIILEREHEVAIELEVGGVALETGETAIVSFVRDDGRSATAAFPGVGEVVLSEGSYEVKVYVYGDSEIRIPASTKTECVEVPREGILGFFGSTEEECFEISVPETEIENALTGGGTLSTFLLESEIEKRNVRISVGTLPPPISLEQLTQNFEIFESKRLEVEFYE